MSLEKRVAAIEQKLGISMDTASAIPTSMDSASAMPTSMDTASAIPTSMDSASMDTASMDSASMDSASMDSASTNTSPEIPTSIDSASMDSASANTSPEIPTSTIISPAIPDSTIISLNGYNGTIKDLFDKIDSKIKNLGSASNKGKYKDRVAELRNLFGNLKKATTVQDIQSTIGSKLSFKNNNLMGGKTKRRGRKTKKSNKSKRR